MIDAGPCGEWRTEPFDTALALAYGQAWRPEPEPGFRPGEVRVGRTDDALEIFASLEGTPAATSATADNQNLWTLGDVFEIFLRGAGNDEYLELHMAPNGLRLQLRFASPASIPDIRDGRCQLTDFIVGKPIFDFAVRTSGPHWQVLASVPLASLGKPSDEIIASFGRYDYAGAAKPVISSTSAHNEPDFHRLHEWTRLTLGRFAPV